MGLVVPEHNYELSTHQSVNLFMFKVSLTTFHPRRLSLGFIMPVRLDLQSVAMGIYAGFDMVPRLTRGIVDTRNWEQFLNSIKSHYEDDMRVEEQRNSILIKAGEHPSLPFEGHKLLRFSAKISGSIAANSGVEAYIDTVTRIAKVHFGSRVQYWHEGIDRYGHYDWTEVDESIQSYEQVRHDLIGLFLDTN